jgi:hypothetical protein
MISNGEVLNLNPVEHNFIKINYGRLIIHLSHQFKFLVAACPCIVNQYSWGRILELNPSDSLLRKLVFMWWKLDEMVQARGLKVWGRLGESAFYRWLKKPLLFSLKTSLIRQHLNGYLRGNKADLLPCQFPQFRLHLHCNLCRCSHNSPCLGSRPLLLCVFTCCPSTPRILFQICNTAKM